MSLFTVPGPSSWLFRPGVFYGNSRFEAIPVMLILSRNIDREKVPRVVPTLEPRLCECESDSWVLHSQDESCFKVIYYLQA